MDFGDEVIGGGVDEGGGEVWGKACEVFDVIGVGAIDDAGNGGGRDGDFAPEGVAGLERDGFFEFDEVGHGQSFMRRVLQGEHSRRGVLSRIYLCGYGESGRVFRRL